MIIYHDTHTRGARGLMRTTRKERNSAVEGEIEENGERRRWKRRWNRKHGRVLARFIQILLVCSPSLSPRDLSLRNIQLFLFTVSSFVLWPYIIFPLTFSSSLPLLLPPLTRSSNASPASFSSTSRTFSSLPSFVRANNGTAIS